MMPSIHRLLLSLLVLFAVLSSLVMSRQVFENLPHLEDEVAYLFQAKVFAHGDITAPVVNPRNAFWQPFVIDHDNGLRFSKYSPGWSLLLAAGVAVGMPALVNALLAGLTVLVTYRIGRETFSRETGLAAAALMAFSPMALLLNATLMAHTAALFFATLFIWAYLRMTAATGGVALKWGAAAGLALGALVAIRPLSAVAVALPFILRSGVALAKAAYVGRVSGIRAVLPPLLILSAGALALAALVPLYNYATTGDPTENLYTLVPNWEYDRVGFGPDIGRNGHTLLKGVQFARYDLTLTAADLFGWQLGGWNDMLTGWVNGIAPEGMTPDSYWPVLGISWILLPLGLIAGFGRRWAAAWVIFGMAWIAASGRFLFNGLELWVAVGVIWAFAPLAWVEWRGEARSRAVWLLFGVMFCLVAVHTAYWIGSQRYSTRYYAEGLTAAALISAVGLGCLMGRGPRWRIGVAGVLTLALAWSFFGYSLPRIDALRGYNRVTGEVIEGVMARREGDRPVLVLVNATDARWRTRAALWTLASPFHDADIEVAYANTNSNNREWLLALMPDRQVIEMGAHIHDLWFMDSCGDGVCDVVNLPVNPTLLLPEAQP